MDLAEPEEHCDSDRDYEEFYFESDHLALRGNVDYTTMLRTIAVLQSQRIQVLKDIDTLANAEKNALENPEQFLQQIAKGETDSLPGPINIIDVPTINFAKYNVDIPEFVKDEPKTDSNEITVRGRLFDQTKPETFNQLWTCEEQRRLEELLIEYPPEPIEMQRFAKIARALGNRTTKQVASRLQKFFKKLHMAGMPIPGRIPKAPRYTQTKAQRMLRHGRPTTFFPANYVPVNITDEDELNGVSLDRNWYRQGCSSMRDTVNNCAGPRKVIVDDGEDEDGDGDNNTENNNEHKQMLKLFLRIQNDRKKDETMERGSSEHDGYKCDICSEEPIIGTRWHCKTCSHTSIDFCTDCVITQTKSSNPHPLTHKLIAFRVLSQLQPSSRQLDGDSDGSDDYVSDDNNKQAADFIQQTDIKYDKDYVPKSFGNNDYNYMDPNFMPE